MPLSKQILLIIVSLIFLSFIAFGLTTGIILSNNYLKLEKESVERNVSQVLNSISTIRANLSAKTPDWAYWDDTLEYALGNNPSYIERNINEFTFESNQVNLVVILDRDRNVLFERAYDYTEGKDVLISPELNTLLTDPRVAVTTDEAPGITGLVLSPSNDPVLVSAYPILDSLAEGPAGGTLIFGIFLNDAAVNEIAALTISTISLNPVDGPGLPESFRQVKDTLDVEGYIVTRPVDRDYVAGYSMVGDIFGDPAMVLQVIRSRDIYKQGQFTFLVFGLTMAVICIIFGILEIDIFKKTIMSRFGLISRGVNLIGETGDISQRINVSGNDDLRRLADNINKMLVKIGETEAQLRIHKNRFDRLQEFTQGVILIFDSRAVLHLVNKMFCTLFCTSEAEAVGKNLADFIPPGIIEGIYPLVTDEEGAVYDTEVKLNINGADKLFSISIITLYSGEYLLLGWDITKERQDMDRMYLTDRLATIGELTSGIAHELNNPLTSVIGLSGLLLEADLPPDIKSDLTTIFQEAKRTSDIVKNMLSFTRNHPSARQKVNVNSILAGTLDMRSYEQNLNKIEVIRRCDDELPWVKADAFQLQQVFLNLIVNAEYFMRETHGRGCLTVATQPVDGMVKISISDDGPGIPQEIIKHIFDPFFTTKPVGKGTGLGLSISYGIINAHNGRIYAENLAGNKGAVFTVELPVDAGAGVLV